MTNVRGSRNRGFTTKQARTSELHPLQRSPHKGKRSGGNERPGSEHNAAHNKARGHRAEVDRSLHNGCNSLTPRCCNQFATSYRRRVRGRSVSQPLPSPPLCEPPDSLCPEWEEEAGPVPYTPVCKAKCSRVYGSRCFVPGRFFSENGAAPTEGQVFAILIYSCLARATNRVKRRNICVPTHYLPGCDWRRCSLCSCPPRASCADQCGAAAPVTSRNSSPLRHSSFFSLPLSLPAAYIHQLENTKFC